MISKALRDTVDQAENALQQRIATLLDLQGKFEIDQYARFLTMQYYLTEDVQQEFYTAAGVYAFHERKELRKFLVQFAEEEEPHYLIAKEDLERLGRTVGEKPIDVYLWKTFFNSSVTTRPCIRIGATCVLENIANKAAEQILQLVSQTPELEKKNTRFLRIHMHGDALPHGDQILEAVDTNNFSLDETKDLELGARLAKKVYLQLVDWIITGEESPSSPFVNVGSGV